MVKLIILDRDGVINQDREDLVKSADEWIPIAGSMDAIASFTQSGYTVVVATNQSGIGRGCFSMQELTEIHSKMHKMVQQAGGQIDGIWFCPHPADADCDCHKPKRGMLADIIERFHAEAQNVYMVGDSLRDLQVIDALDGKPILVLTGKGKRTLASHGDVLPENTQIFENLMAFSQHLMQLDKAEEENA